MLLRITAPHFVAGVVIAGGVCTRTAPILGYMRGWTATRIRDYCHQKRWHVEVFP